jgi:hypothetical protein
LGLALLEYNLEQSDLGNAINKKMKKKEKNNILHIKAALQDLLPRSDSHNRYNHDNHEDQKIVFFTFHPLTYFDMLKFFHDRMTRGAVTNIVTPPVNQVGQQVDKKLCLNLAVTAIKIIYSGIPMELNTHVAPVGNQGLNNMTPTEVEPGKDPTKNKTHNLEPDQTVVFDQVVRLMLQQNGGEETKPKLVLGPAGTGKTRLDPKARSLSVPPSMLLQQQQSEVTRFQEIPFGMQECTNNIHLRSAQTNW